MFPPGKNYEFCFPQFRSRAALRGFINGFLDIPKQGRESATMPARPER